MLLKISEDQTDLWFCGYIYRYLLEIKNLLSGYLFNKENNNIPTTC